MPIDHLSIDGLSVSFADRRVLTDVSLTAPPGERVAVVGENGSGKSTLLRCAAGDLVPDTGNVERPERVGLLHQELPFAGSDTVAEVLEAAVAPVRRLAAEVERLGEELACGAAVEAAVGSGCSEVTTRTGSGAATLADRFSAALAEAELAQAWSVEARVHEATAGLGIADVPQDRRMSEISGGQRRRLALAALLLAHPTLLVLDEPTNHLDDAGLDYLAAELRAWSGPVLFASHDRVFLDEVATRVVDLDPAPSPVGQTRQGVVYTGAYSDYLIARHDEHRRWQERFEAEQQELTRLRHLVDVSARDVFHRTTAKSEARIATKFYGDRAASTIGRRVRSARSQLERLEAEQVRKPPKPLRFSGFGAPVGSRARAPTGHDASQPGEVFVAAQSVAVAGRLGLVSTDVRAGDRLLVTGPNGSGKSTLLAVLAGMLVPTAGRLLRADRVRIGLLTQDLGWEADDLADTPTGVFDRRGVWPPNGLLHPRDLRRPLRELSLGTQRRVTLALLLADPPDVLLLDEPTNHLSLALTEELEAALPDYPGAVVVATHDRWLRRRWHGRTLRLASVSRE